MTPHQFYRILGITRMPPDSASARAARMVLVLGSTAYAAAKANKINESAVSRAVKRLRTIADSGLCPCCGRAL
jgi:hypothetical protein